MPHRPRALDQYGIIKLQAYKSACDRLNALDAMRKDKKVDNSTRNFAENAYWDAMNLCDQYASYFGLRGLDVEQLLEENRARLK